MGKAYRAERKRENALMRQFAKDFTYVLEYVKKAEQLSAIAVAEEITGYAESAMTSYKAVIIILSDVEATVRQYSDFYGTLVGVVEEELELARQDLESVAMVRPTSPDYLARSKPHFLNTSLLYFLHN